MYFFIQGECQADNECPDNKACINYSCVDACAGGACGAGAICNAKRHLAVCTCPSGTEGDASVSCSQSRSFPVARYNRYKKEAVSSSDIKEEAASSDLKEEEKKE